ncbi:MAG: hypothetical protein ICV60_17560 [Pyrinomonadaceae bacterium]|nr:hypothetical protein [Pyrinomonadaceae bacterium]
MPLLTQFDTPGSLRDFPAGSAFYGRWHDVINGMLGATPTPGSGGVGELYNPHVTNVNVVGERLLVWMGFPRGLLLANRDNRQQAFELGDKRSATERNTQVEYLEWQMTKEGGKIKKVTFVTETPEYWQTMFTFDRNRVLSLYRELVNPSITMADITDAGGSYNPLNAWNTTKGIVHYIVVSPANTLSAAIGLAKDSVTLGRATHAQDNYELSPGAQTSADPRVQTDVNMLARKGLSVTGREPIGLYMVAWDDTGWTKPDGSPVGNYWRIPRGRPGAALRLEYEVPASEGFFVSDIRIGGRPITHGGHLAEHVTVMLGGIAGTRAA